MERMRALRQLGAWARAGTLPGEEQLDRAITGATNIQAEDFGTEAAYRAAQGSAYSALLALEKVGVRQVSDAERQIAAIETASDRAAAAYEAQLAAIDAQAEQAAGQRDAALEILARQEESATAWRDQELARLEAETEAAQTWRDENLAAIDDLLALAAKQVAILEGTYVETKSLAEALNDLNDALIGAGGEPLAPTQADLAALLPPMGDIAAATNATTTEVIALRQEIVVLRQDLAAVATAQVVPLKAIDERLRKWDLDGMPSSAEATGTETALRAA
jgi:chromosome segregation ATPase